jgi:hypothetical protein
MEELSTLHEYLVQQRYTEALELVTEMEEMSREDKINKIGSFVRVLLVHLIKRHAERRTTRSWDTSIFNALFEMSRVNKRRKAGGFYVNSHEMHEIIEAYYPSALSYATLEAFEGRYDADELERLFDPGAVRDEAFHLISEHGATA